MGDRKGYLLKALDLIEDGIGPIHKKSSVYETEPWGLKEQEKFLNMAISVKSAKSAEEIMYYLKNIESSIGSLKVKKWGPRNIDIDILYCDGLIIKTENMTIPHPHIYERNFVLIPLMEIAGDFIDPVKQMTIDELYDNCKDINEVFIFEE